MTDSSPEAIFFEEGPDVPNHEWPLLVYRGALPEDTDAAGATALLAEHGWGGAWTNGVYPFTHYHSNAHEVLAVVRGEARVRFGGAEGQTLALRAGDVAVLPAGTGHRRVDAGGGFSLVGAYPEGQHDWDLRRPDDEEAPVPRAQVLAVPRPTHDPLHGPGGPLLTHWRPSGAE